MTIRNRIVRHVRVRAATWCRMNSIRASTVMPSAKPSPPAWRKSASRSLLAYELPDGRLKLIDGHLRRPASRPGSGRRSPRRNRRRGAALLLTLDPLTLLADYDSTVLDQLRQQTSTTSNALDNLWRLIDTAGEAVGEAMEKARKTPGREPPVVEQFLILVECTTEKQQTDLLWRFQRMGLKCKALLS